MDGWGTGVCVCPLTALQFLVSLFCGRERAVCHAGSPLQHNRFASRRRRRLSRLAPRRRRRCHTSLEEIERERKEDLPDHRFLACLSLRSLEISAPSLADSQSQGTSGDQSGRESCFPPSYFTAHTHTHTHRQRDACSRLHASCRVCSDNQSRERERREIRMRDEHPPAPPSASVEGCRSWRRMQGTRREGS